MGYKPRIRFKGFTEDWEQCKLSDVADVRDGTHDSPKFYNDGFPLVTSKNLKGGSIDFSDCSFISEQDFNEINKRSKVDPGDILFGMIGTIGNPAIVEHTGFAIKNVALIKEGNIINNRFIYHLLSSEVFENYIARENAGGTQKFIALNQIRNFDFLAPALVEQNKIIELLDCISQNITLHQCKLEKLKLTKKALLQKLFPKNGKHIPEIRFKGFTDAWEQRKLGNLTQLITKGTTPKVKNIQNGINFIKVENISDDGVISINSYVSEEEHMNYLSRSILANNDILFSIAGTLGRTAIVKSHLLPANTNQALAIIRLNKSVDVEYINTFLKSNAIKTYIRKNPTVGAQPNLSLGQVSDLEINIPNYSEQKKISNLFSKFDLMITLHQ